MNHDEKDTCCSHGHEKTVQNERPSRHLGDPVIIFDLESQLKEIKQEDAWNRNGHNARTLVKHPDFRVVLVAMKKSSQIKEHKVEGRISVQTLQGHIRLQVSGQPVNLPTGNMIALDQALSHDIDALEESAFLLSISGIKSI